MHRTGLHIYAYAAERIPQPLASQYINDTNRGVDAKCDRLYSVGDPTVTGVRLEVQAKVCSQHAAIHAIADAVSIIETEDLDEFAFVCDHGTHRSVACACLLIALVYGDAKVVLTTRRTCDSGRRWLC